MNLAGKVAAGISALVISGLVVLAAPAIAAVYGQAASGSDGTPHAQPTGQGASGESGAVSTTSSSPEGCEKQAWLNLGRMSASLSGDLIDRGQRDFAAGSVGMNDQGGIATYTVAPGDALYAIGDRFCIADPLVIATLNHTRTIQPGEVLLLHPDASIPWIPYFNPDDAPAGYQQIPYQRAVEAMCEAARAGDLDAMRAIFEADLSGLFPNPADAAVIADALDDGNLEVLRQMFA